MGNIFNPDFRDFISLLTQHKVEYLLVGGYSVILHGNARVTGDMDIWVNRTKENYDRLVLVFDDFNLPVFDMTEVNFLTHKTWDVFKFGRKPVAIDIMVKVKGLDFDTCYANSVTFAIEEITVRTLNLDSLLNAKKQSARHKDLDDIENLKKRIK